MDFTFYNNDILKARKYIIKRPGNITMQMITEGKNKK